MDMSQGSTCDYSHYGELCNAYTVPDISLNCHGKIIRALFVVLGLEERSSALGSLRIIPVRVTRMD